MTGKGRRDAFSISWFTREANIAYIDLVYSWRFQHVLAKIGRYVEGLNTMSGEK